jgi:exopolysaccharide biosynthesis protein
MKLFSNDLGIDLGTSNVLISAENSGIVIREPSVVAVDKNTEVGLAWSGTNNPRCAIGYVSKGHYLVLVVDGRCDQSPGTSLWELAQVFCELGAETAYNLDGGGSATMIFNGKLINTPYTSWNKPSGERRVSDIVYFGYEYPRS